MERFIELFSQIDYVGVAIAVFLVIQIAILLRIRDILNGIATHLSRINAYYQASPTFIEEGEEEYDEDEIELPEVCQFCKHRVAYIGSGNTAQNGEEIFYRCALLNKEIEPTDSCPHFEYDEYLME
ncbi:MAG: hypothetical protein D6715_12200 [Calditrichaeota bacterium]|nr:MAG: hypothetical protein D6715_12200 [Calditrichota bacterium]